MLILCIMETEVVSDSADCILACWMRVKLIFYYTIRNIISQYFTPQKLYLKYGWYHKSRQIANLLLTRKMDVGAMRPNWVWQTFWFDLTHSVIRMGKNPQNTVCAQIVFPFFSLLKLQMLLTFFVTISLISWT